MCIQMIDNNLMVPSGYDAAVPNVPSVTVPPIIVVKLKKGD